jgi:hypothetical protein
MELVPGTLVTRQKLAFGGILRSRSQGVAKRKVQARRKRDSIENMLCRSSVRVRIVRRGEVTGSGWPHGRTGVCVVRVSCVGFSPVRLSFLATVS